MTDLEDGGHTLHVRVRDAAGNASEAFTHTWIRDTTTPDAPVLSEQPAGYSDADEISWTGEDHPVFEYRLDDGEWIRAAGPLDLSGLPDGAHIFEVRQTDEAGNVSEVALRKSTRDTVTPDAPVLSDRPLGHSAANDISWTGEEHAVFEYQLDSGESGARSYARSL